MRRILISLSLLAVACTADHRSPDAHVTIVLPPSDPPPMSSPWHVGGMVSGLDGTVVLENNGGDALAVDANGAFVFGGALTTRYDVTVARQPAGQRCTVSRGVGAMASSDVSDVGVACADLPFTIGGTVSGLVGAMVLQSAGGEQLEIKGDGPFAFPTLAQKYSPYAISVAVQPVHPNQTCVVTNGVGIVGKANVSDVHVSCATNVYALKVDVSGYVGDGLVLRNGDGDVLPIPLGGVGTFTFPGGLEDGRSYHVVVMTQPSDPGQICTADPKGTVDGGDVTVNVSCQ
jgi:hypothetical protein